MFVVLISVGLIATVEAGFYAYRYTTQQRSFELLRRLQSLRTGGGEAVGLLRPGRYAKTEALEALLRRVPGAGRVEALLVQADSSHTVAQVLGYCALTALAGLTVGLTIAGRGAGLLLAAAAGASPILLLLRARASRSRRLSEQMPDALDTMARSLRAGHAIVAAFEFVATEMPEPICVEFGRAVEEQRMGLTVEDAVVHMTERLPMNSDLKIFAVSTIIQKETGGNLAEILGNIARTIRARYAFYGKLRALTGEGRASAVLLGSLPFVAGVGMQLLKPGWLAPLLTTPVGQAIFGYAILSWAVGLLLMYRMTKLDY